MNWRYIVYGQGILFGIAGILTFSPSHWLFYLATLNLCGYTFLLTHYLITKRTWKGLLRRGKK